MSEELKMNGVAGEIETATPTKPKKTRAKRPPSIPVEVDEFGLVQGSLRSRAAAMYARDDGATLSEVKNALKCVQFNVLTQLEKKGHGVKRVKENIGDRKITRYFLSR
jgi:hypothetical protein